MPVSLAKINFRLVSIPFLYISYAKNSLTINYKNPKVNITHDEDITILPNRACTIFLLHKTGLLLFVLHKTSLTGSVLLSSVLIIFKIVSKSAFFYIFGKRRRIINLSLDISVCFCSIDVHFDSFVF